MPKPSCGSGTTGCTRAPTTAPPVRQDAARPAGPAIRFWRATTDCNQLFAKHNPAVCTDILHRAICTDILHFPARVLVIQARVTKSPMRAPSPRRTDEGRRGRPDAPTRDGRSARRGSRRSTYAHAAICNMGDLFGLPGQVGQRNLDARGSGRRRRSAAPEVHLPAACASAEGVLQPTIAGASCTSSSFSRAATMNKAKSTRRVMLLSRIGSPTCRLHTGRP